MSQKTEAKAVAYDTQPAGLEKWVDETFNKKAPFKFPENFRTWLADNAWWLVLIGAILTLWSVWGAWQAAMYTSEIVNWANEMSRAYGGPVTTPQLGLFWYLAVAGLVIQCVMYFMASSKLREHKKSGWNLLFYASLVSLVVGLLYLFSSYFGAGSFIGTLIGTAIGWYVLFQIRDKFTTAG